jgi:GxxExxY protein
MDVPIVFDQIKFNEGLRLDVMVNNLVICELKALEVVNPVWDAQLLSHLKLTNKRLGYLINFNVPLVRDGIKRMVL